MASFQKEDNVLWCEPLLSLTHQMSAQKASNESSVIPMNHLLLSSDHVMAMCASDWILKKSVPHTDRSFHVRQTNSDFVNYD